MIHVERNLVVSGWKGAMGVALLITACGNGSGAPTSGASSMASAGPPEAGISATEAEMIRTMTENIDLLYCAVPPTPDWCQNLIRGDSGYNIGLEGSVLNVGTNLASGDLARELCAAVAAAHFDADAEPLGFTHVEVGGHTGEVIAECDIP